MSWAIAERLREQIMHGQLPAGSALKQDALANSFGVSRIPLREALIQLEAEGLVKIEPHKGAVVASFELDELRDVFELRRLLEPRLLQHAIAHLQAQDHALIDALDASFSSAVATRDIARWGQLNAQFHLALYQRAGLPKTYATVVNLLQASDRYTRLQMNREIALEQAQLEHRELARLCKIGDATAACALLAAHIDAVFDDLQHLLPSPTN